MIHPEGNPGAAALDWLLAACRSWLAPGGAGVEAGGDPDWRAVERLAYLHNLEPLLHALRVDGRLAAAAVPGGLAERWEAAHYQNYVFNAELLDLLSRFLTRCAGLDLGVVVFKGPVTVARAYGNAALRVMHDVDLLCRERDLEALSTVARALGFDAGAETSVYHLSLGHRELESGIELHFDLYGFLGDRRRLVDSVLGRPEVVQVEDSRLPAPSPEVGLLLEAAHLVNHDFEVQLRSLVDLAALLTRAPFRPGRLRELLRRHDLEPEFAFAAGLVEELFGLPGACGLARHRSPDGGLRRRVLDHLAAPEAGAARPMLAEAAARPGVAAKLGYARRLLFPPLSHLRAIRGTGSSARAFLYLPRHLARTVGRGWRKWRTAGLSTAAGSIKRRAFARRRRARGRR